MNYQRSPVTRPSTERFERLIEISAAAYKEIADQLIASGYEFLVFPPQRGLKLDGFILVERK